MERVDILNALRLVSDYCGTVVVCKDCLIRQQCKRNWQGQPNEWNLDDDV